MGSSPSSPSPKAPAQEHWAEPNQPGAAKTPAAAAVPPGPSAAAPPQPKTSPKKAISPATSASTANSIKIKVQSKLAPDPYEELPLSVTSSAIGGDATTSKVQIAGGAQKQPLSQQQLQQHDSKPSQTSTLGTTVKGIGDINLDLIRISFLSQYPEGDKTLDTALTRDLPEEWLKTYSIGIYEIDAQHKKLFDIIESLAKLKEHEYAGADAVINGCLEYTKYHFTAEEHIQTVIGWEDIEKHKKEHEKFVNKVMEVIYKLDFHDLPAIDEFTQFLWDWLVDHIKERDRHFADYVLAPENAHIKQRLLDDGVMITQKTR